MSIQTQSSNPFIESVGIVRSYARKSEIFRESDAANRIYEVVSGAVCTRKILREGRRQIAGFYFAGEMFGLESVKQHRVTAEAITNAQVRIFEKRALSALASPDGQVGDRLLSLTARELARQQDHFLLLSRSTHDRLIGFIIDLARRTSRKDDRIDLPMYREHMADYLGLALETVSRTLNEFERRGAIKISKRHIVLNSRSVNGKTEADRLFRAFEGIRRHPPKTEHEFQEWLASSEGKAATVFELTSLSRWGDRARS